MLNPNIIGMEHYNVARGVQKVLQDYKNLQVRLLFSGARVFGCGVGRPGAKDT